MSGYGNYGNRVGAGGGIGGQGLGWSWHGQAPAETVRTYYLPELDESFHSSTPKCNRSMFFLSKNIDLVTL